MMMDDEGFVASAGVMFVLVLGPRCGYLSTTMTAVMVVAVVGSH